MWHVTRDMWHVACDMGGGGRTVSKNFSSVALTVWERQFFLTYLKKGWMSDLINYKGVCRIAPATPGLLIPYLISRSNCIFWRSIWILWRFNYGLASWSSIFCCNMDNKSPFWLILFYYDLFIYCVMYFLPSLLFPLCTKFVHDHVEWQV